MEEIGSPSIFTPKGDSHPTVSPWLDEPESSTPTCTSVATVSNHMENLIPCVCLARKNQRMIIALEKMQEYLDLI